MEAVTPLIFEGFTMGTLKKLMNISYRYEIINSKNIEIEDDR